MQTAASLKPYPELPAQGNSPIQPELALRRGGKTPRRRQCLSTHFEQSNERQPVAESKGAFTKSMKFLGQSQIEMIDEALASVGPYGEVQLIVEKGRPRFVVTKSIHDALKWSAGSLQSNGQPSQ